MPKLAIGLEQLLTAHCLCAAPGHTPIIPTPPLSTPMPRLAAPKQATCSHASPGSIMHPQRNMHHESWISSAPTHLPLLAQVLSGPSCKEGHSQAEGGGEQGGHDVGGGQGGEEGGRGVQVRE